MNKTKKVLATAITAAAAVAGLSACSSSADVVSHNLSKEADQFKVWRQVVLYNGITDKYIVEIDGYCSLGNNDPRDKISVTCKVDNNDNTDSYVKDIYTRSDNTIVISHQVKAIHVNPNRYKVVLKPETVIPDIDVVR